MVVWPTGVAAFLISKLDRLITIQQDICFFVDGELNTAAAGRDSESDHACIGCWCGGVLSAINNTGFFKPDGDGNSNICIAGKFYRDIFEVSSVASSLFGRFKLNLVVSQWWIVFLTGGENSCCSHQHQCRKSVQHEWVYYLFMRFIDSIENARPRNQERP